jgi:hypothetical protein
MERLPLGSLRLQSRKQKTITITAVVIGRLIACLSRPIVLVGLGGAYFLVAYLYNNKLKWNDVAIGTTPTIHSTRVRTRLRDNDGDDDLCLHVSSSLDIASWPDIIYHKDRDGYSSNYYYYDGYVNSVEVDDQQARATIHEFNKIRSSVLTSPLLKTGFQPGRIYPIRRFADRIRRLAESNKAESPPLRILVFGSSFTIGSNCGESTAQESDDCAWPLRLARRFDEIFFPYINDEATRSSLVQWTMYQENAQGSVNIAQKIPSIIDEFINESTSPDAILLDNTIIDLGMNKPWFEAVVRAFLKSFPETVIVSIVDGVPQFVDNPKDSDNSWLYQVQKHYGLMVVDFATMARMQRHDTDRSDYLVKKIYSDQSTMVGNEDYDAKSTLIDLLWPQASYMKFANGTIAYDDDADNGEIYWTNFFPRTRKTKLANYPENHPPWVTHQYVADGVMHGLLNLARIGLGCGGVEYEDESLDSSSESVQSLLKTSVATAEELNACFICDTPVMRIDAKSPPYVDHVIANLIPTVNSARSTEVTPDIQSNDDTVALICGDWKWITDDRNRSGWQSDEYGSIIRFRLRVSNDKLPTLSFTYMRSHDTFGNLRVTFQAVSRNDLNNSPSNIPTFGCNDVNKFEELEDGTTLIPSIGLDGSLPRFSLWETAVFPPELDDSDVNAEPAWNLLDQTVLSRMRTTGDGDKDKVIEFVDLYVINTNSDRTRIKIQVVTSC